MEEFAKSLSSISWWLGVVFVGIILNILSAYLKPIIDMAFSKMSVWWRDRSEKSRAVRALLVADLRGNEHKQVLMLAKENRHRLKGIVFLIFSLVLLLLYLSMKISFSISISTMSVPPPFWFRQIIYWSSVVSIFFWLLENSAAARCNSLVSEAQVEPEDE